MGVMGDILQGRFDPEDEQLAIREAHACREAYAIRKAYASSAPFAEVRSSAKAPASDSAANEPEIAEAQDARPPG